MGRRRALVLAGARRRARRRAGRDGGCRCRLPCGGVGRAAGRGVVGLAVARELALAGSEVIVLESTELIGSETSSRNSEVIHAGIYYPKDSL